jgi:hypothetical protein
MEDRGHEDPQGFVAKVDVHVLNSGPLNMPKAKTAKTPTKADFIRSQPATLSADDVVTKAKSAGLTIDRNLVYKVRGRLRSNGRSKKASTTTSGIAKRPQQSKADFVRANRNLSPKEVAAKAKAAGIKLDVSYVYNVRGYDKSAGKKRATAKKTTSTPIATNGTRSFSSVSTKAEALLKAVAAELGLGRAIEILVGERALVRAVIEG